jgi:hypothetical protein
VDAEKVDEPAKAEKDSQPANAEEAGEPSGQTAASQEEAKDQADEKDSAKAAEGAAANQDVPTQEKSSEESGETASAEKKAVDGEDPGIKGDEDEVESMEHKDDDIPKIPEDFFYDYKDHVSQAKVSEESGLPTDLLTLHHSFGYDCQRRSNLHIIDKEHIVFIAGNMVEIVNISTKEQQYLRSTSGGGIGAIAVS